MFKFNYWDRKKPNLVFLHVPKCGGTSVDTSIRQEFFTLLKSNDSKVYDRVDSQNSAYIGGLLYGLNFMLGDVKNNRNLVFNKDYVAYKLLFTDIKYISGHFPFDRELFEEFKNEYDFFTILRDPVEKWLSNFHYRGKRKSKIRGREVYHWKITEEIEVYLESERGKFHGYDYVKYFGGIREDYDYTSEEAIKIAKENLKKFKIIGFLDDMSSLSRDLKKSYGFDIQFTKLNVSRKNDDIKISNELKARIEEICAADIEIYRYAKLLENNNF